LDVLESRLKNLLLIQAKRNPAGIAQAQLAINIVEGFLDRLLNEAADIRVVFDAIERVAQIATNKALTGVMSGYSLDVLSAVPVERIEHPAFQTQRWPKIVQTVTRQQRQYQQLRARRRKPGSRPQL
jgi:hypothetical protein